MCFAFSLIAIHCIYSWLYEKDDAADEGGNDDEWGDDGDDAWADGGDEDEGLVVLEMGEDDT